ncbi:MAG: hypothetical protein JW940_08210 [Polyangiaceae bacterium]|nr:hypothetical protein [Polyangiaceae bacterium]
MADAAQLLAWVRQARADLDASISRGSGVAECRRRYLLQQACEKGMKALGLVLWDERTADVASFGRFFLHRHDPLSRLRTQPDLPRSLWALLRQVDAELESIDNAALLRKVDSTCPSTDPSDVSYRYPFVDARSGAIVAPVDLSTDDWDAYQGNEMGVARAVARLIDRVESRIRKSRAL